MFRIFLVLLSIHLCFGCLEFPGTLSDWEQVSIGCDASGLALASSYSRLYVACDNGYVTYFDPSETEPTVTAVSGLATELFNLGLGLDIESVEYVSSFPDRLYLALEGDNVIVELDIVTETIVRVFDLTTVSIGSGSGLQSITWVPDENDAPGNPSGTFLVSKDHEYYLGVYPTNWLDDTIDTLEESTLHLDVETNNIGRDYEVTGTTYDADNELFWTTVNMNGVLAIRIHDSNFCFRATYETTELGSDKDHEGIAVDNSDPLNYRVYVARDDSGVVLNYNWGDISTLPPCFPFPQLQAFPAAYEYDDDNVIVESDDEEFSGIVYVPITNELVGVSDKGKLFTIDANNEYTKVRVSKKPSTISNDFEGITIVRSDEPIVYIADEQTSQIWEYNYVAKTSHRVFDLSSYLPAGAEIEALVFKPDNQSAPLVTGVFLVGLGNGGNIYEFRIEDVYDLNNNNLADPIVHYGRFCDDIIRGGNYDWYTQKLYWIYSHEDERYIASQNEDMDCFLDRWEHPGDAANYGQREGIAFRGNEMFITTDKDTNGKIFFYDWSSVTEQSTCGTF